MTYFTLNKNIHLGATQSGKRLYLDPKLRKTHMHVIGASGRGKSYFLEYLIRQDIKNGDGVCLIDPHGTLYHKIVAWCAEPTSLVSWDKLILLDASAPGWTFGFNPIDFTGADISYAVDSMVNACAQVWGGEDTSSTPRLKRVLRGVFHALAERELTLLEAEHLINELDQMKPLRQFLTKGLDDSVIRGQWEKWHGYKKNEFRDEFSSATNRLSEFISAPVIRTILGQKEQVIDFRKIMDEGYIVLVNLEARGQLSDFNARTLGTLLTNDLFLKAQGRPEGSRPFYFYIDECGRYLNESIQRILDESRKRGLHLILANQHLSQLRAAGDTVYSAVMTDAQTKVVFGGLQSEEADTVVKDVFLDLDLEEPKQSLTRRVAVGQEKIILQSGSTGESSARSHTTAHGTTDGATSGGSTTTLADGDEGSSTSAWGISSGETTTESDSVTESVSEMNGWTESFRTIYESAPGAVFSLEEQRYKKSAWLKKQPQQMALLVQPDFLLIPFRVATLRQPRTTSTSVDRFTNDRFEEIPCVTQEHKILEQIKRREQDLKQQAGIIPGTAEDEFDPFDNG